MIYFKIENNHRSTKNIVHILNIIRNDDSLVQNCPKEKIDGTLPIIFVGNMFDAYKKAIELLKSKDIYTLSYKTIVARSMKNKREMEEDNFTLGSFINDSNRGYQILQTIYSLEYVHQQNMKEALHHLKKIRKFTDKEALFFLKKLYNQYDLIKNMSLTNFYNNLLIADLKSPKISRGKMKTDFYDLKMYQDIASCLKFDDEKGRYMNIHQAKGAEFENVIVVIFDPKKAFNEDKDLAFLLNPDIKQEDNRVLYVAVSRAKQNLFLSVPSLSKINEEKLINIGFQICPV